jgi:hypothetical protein
MSVLVCVLFVAGFGWALASNPDKFSPAKFFLFSFLVFYAGAFSSTATWELWLLMLIVLLVGLLTVQFEAIVRYPTAVALRRVPQRVVDEKHFVPWIWLLSAPAIVSQIAVVQMFGGIEGYINIIGNRVVELRGLGWAKTMISTIMVFNLIYFAVGLTRRRSRGWWAGYLVHLLILVAMGLLSGSRGALLTVFAMQLFCLHYLRGRVKLLRTLVVGSALLAVAMVIGVAREGIKLEDDTLSTGLDEADEVLQVSIFSNGVLPLEILLDAGSLRLAYGSTLLSLATNAVPRAWWPEKPDTGGVFFTKEYTDDAWDGASNLTPTFLGEAVINFGWIGGVVFFLVAYPAMMYGLVAYYRRTQRRLRDAPGPGTAIDLVIYLFVMWSFVALMTGEVTNVLLNLVLTQVIPAAATKALLTRRRKARPSRARAGLADGAARS